jgi:hypothetical protein
LVVSSLVAARDCFCQIHRRRTALELVATMAAAASSSLPRHLLRVLSLLAVAALVVASGGGRLVIRESAVVSLAELDGWSHAAARKNPSSYDDDSERAAEMLGN